MMGSRGPAKTPVAVLKARGTYRSDRHSDEIDSDLPPSLPDPPEHFTDEQQTLWRDIGGQLAARGLMTDLDGPAFELLIGAYVGMVQAQKELANDSLIVYVGELQTPMANPLIHVIQKSTTLLKWALCQFGCTPSSRTGIVPAKRVPKTIDPMLALLGGQKTPKKPAKAPVKKRPAKRVKK